MKTSIVDEIMKEQKKSLPLLIIPTLRVKRECLCIEEDTEDLSLSFITTSQHMQLVHWD